MKSKGRAYMRAEWSLKKNIENREKGKNPLSDYYDLDSMVITHASKYLHYFTVQAYNLKIQRTRSIHFPYWNCAPKNK